MTARVIAPKNTIAAALLLAAAGFITSLLIEHVGLLVPCELCLIQRWSVFAAVLFLGVSLRSPGRSIAEHCWFKSLNDSYPRYRRTSEQ
jgi:disulfide bond formation protein DsbB